MVMTATPSARTSMAVVPLAISGSGSGSGGAGAGAMRGGGAAGG